MRIIIAEKPWGFEREMMPDDELFHHPQSQCEGEYCIIHNPSDHHMQDWDQVWRFDRGLPLLIERKCPEHFTGHPDPDVASFFKKINKEILLIHGCCGCCRKENNGRENS